MGICSQSEQNDEEGEGYVPQNAMENETDTLRDGDDINDDEEPVQQVEGGDGWPCVACTYLNTPDSKQCAMCGGSKDNATDSFGMNVPKQMSSNDDMFKSYAEMAQQENQRRATQIEEATDIFSRMDIKSLPNVEGTFGRIDNEESGEYIITYWTRMYEEGTLFIPTVITDLIVTYVDMVYQSRWSSTLKGPDFSIALTNKCRASLRSNFGTIKQSIRALNCCLRHKVSVFYIRLDGYRAEMDTRRNFIGIVPEYEESVNLPLPKEGYGILCEDGIVYKMRREITNGKAPQLRSGRQRVKCVVDLRDDRHEFTCWIGQQCVTIKLPDEKLHERYKDMKWYPYISGDFTNMTCIIEFDTFDKIYD